MDPSKTQSRIEELERVRKETALWRGGALAVVAASIAASAAFLVSDARGLVAQGPTQDRFVASLQQGLNEHVVPRLREVAGKSLSEMQPIVQKEFQHLDERVPDITQASLKQLDELQVSLPKRSERAIEETLGQALREKEPQIRAQFPTVNEATIAKLVENLSEVAARRSARIGESLLQPHLDAMNRIHGNLGRIASTDKLSTGDSADDWMLGLAVFDVLRSDLEEKKPFKAVRKVAEKGTKEDKA